MNVGNVLATMTAQTPAAMGANANQDVNAGLGNLFSLQFGDALVNLQQTQLPTAATGELSGDDISQLTDLLALIQQMMSSPQQQVQPQTVADETQNIDLLTAKLGGQTAVTVDNAQPLLSALTQQGFSQKESTKLVELLVSLAKNVEQPQTVELNAVAQQADTLLKQFGVKIQKDAPQQEIKATILSKGTFIPVRHQHLMHETATATEKATTQMQPLQYQLAMAKYNAEAAVGSGRVTTNLQQDGTNVQTVALTEDVNPEQATTVAPMTSGMNSANMAETQAPVENHPVRAEHFNREVAQIFVKQLQIVGKQGFSEAKLILYPQALGQVDVKITSQNGVITAHLTADSQAGKELLDNQLPQLRAALVQQGLQIDRLEVSGQPQQNAQQQFTFQQQREQSRQQQHDGRDQRKQGNEEQPEFSIDALVDRNEPVAALWNRLRGRGNVEYSV